MFKSRRYLSSVVLLAGVAMLATPLGAQREKQSLEVGQYARDGVRRAKKLTKAQADNLDERIETAMRIVDQFESEARALGRAATWRQVTVDALLSLSLEKLRHVERSAATVDSLPAAISAANADPQLLGDPDSDLVYTPVDPCRFSDSRIVGGRITGFRAYDMDNTGAVYGGTAACHPPTLFGVANADEIPAAVINVTLIDPTIAPGFVAIKPNALSTISSINNWYETGPFVQNSNTAVASIEQDLAAAEEFVIQTSAPVHVITDIFGAFLPPQATSLQQTFPTGSVVIPSGQFGSVTTPACPAGYVITGGQCSSSENKPELTDTFISNGGWQCGARNTGGGTLTVTATAICSRVPGR